MKKLSDAIKGVFCNDDETVETNETLRVGYSPEDIFKLIKCSILQIYEKSANFVIPPGDKVILVSLNSALTAVIHYDFHPESGDHVCQIDCSAACPPNVAISLFKALDDNLPTQIPIVNGSVIWPKKSEKEGYTAFHLDSEAIAAYQEMLKKIGENRALEIERLARKGERETLH